ncbi:MAG: XRE family transcriptional regulator [Pseudonocardiaceae bacterium]
MAAGNEELRAARQRTASLTSPEVCLSRQELAELVNAWVWEHHQKRVEHSANWVCQLECGKIRWPGKVSREALRVILGASTDAELGFVNARSARAAVKLEDVNRQQFLRTTRNAGALAVLAPVAALLEGGEPTPIPRRVGATEIEQTRSATRVFESWSGTYGGGGLPRETVMGQLRWSAGLLDAICPDRLRPELFSAVGDLADVAGYLAVDAGADEQADRVYRFALDCAEEAGDWLLRGEILSSMAKHAVWIGQPDEGLTLAEQGLVRPDRLTAAGRSLLHTDRGRALAKMRRVSETLAAIGTADDHFAHFTPDNEPPFMACYNDVRHAQLAGQPLADLVILGRDPGEATDRLAAAAAGHTAGNTRARAVCLTKLASLTMATGDPIQAAAIGHEALDAAGTLRSRNVTDGLRELARYAVTHQRLDEVAHLRHRIATLVCTDSP